ncbi:MAG: hypothetical protein M1821_000329 [Bathelium mastoideum]|nr:MAG: hypothetical protein M1821_000329 [Bathelium mastoideum]
MSPRTASEVLALFTPKKPKHASSDMIRYDSPSDTDSPTSAEMHDSPSNDAIQTVNSTVPNGQLTPSPASTSHAITPPVLDSSTDPESEPFPQEDEASSPLAKLATAGRSLRPRSSLSRPAALSEFVDLSPAKPKRAPQTPTKSSHADSRKKVEAELSTARKIKRDNFFLANRRLFTSLLPTTNYLDTISKGYDNDSDQDTNIVAYEHLKRQPRGINAVLKSYQLEGLSFLVHMHDNCMPCILGDEMGLGKTLQVLSLFQYIKDNRSTPFDESRPFLVICPLSVLDHWVQEAKRFTPELEPLYCHGSTQIDKVKELCSTRRTDAKNPFGPKTFYLVVTTYETFSAEQIWFKRAVTWRYVVLDEGHKIKNDGSLVARSLQNVKAEYRIILTGTPVQNNLHEMWCLLHWLYPEVFTDRTEKIFQTSFDLSRGMVSTTVVNNARKLLERIMLRRMKNSPGVDLALPPKTKIQLLIPLTPMQKYWYTRLLTGADTAVIEDLFQDIGKKERIAILRERIDSQPDQDLSTEAPDNGALDKWREIKGIMHDCMEPDEEAASHRDQSTPLMNLVLQLRKCCAHPYLFPEAAPDPYYLGEHVIQASAKFVILAKIIEELVVRDGRKVLIFSGMSGMLDYCEELLELKSHNGCLFKHVRLDGSTCAARRSLHVRLFSNPQSAYKVFLISTRAGGLGLNLTAATEVVFLDEDWNPQSTIQAESRAHRIGQTKPVTIYKLCTQGTVEEQMLSRIRKKLYLSAKITEPRTGLFEGHGELESLGSSQLKSLLRRGARTLSYQPVDVTEMLSWDWKTTLEKCKNHAEEPVVADTNDHHINVDEQTWLSSMERVECAIFDGKRYDRKRKHAYPEVATYGPLQKRARQQRTVEIETEAGTFAVSRDNLAAEDRKTRTPIGAKKPKIDHQKASPLASDKHEISLTL